MKTKSTIKIIGCALTMLLISGGMALAAKKPNVILIVTDDMGWGDPGSYGFDRGIKTPSVNQHRIFSSKISPN